MSRFVRPKRVVSGVAVLATAALALAACTPGSNSASNQTSAGQSPSEVVTDISKVGKQTLTVWDQEVRGGQNEQIERLNAAFEEKYPNITIDRVKQSTDDLNTTLRLALTGNDAPDVTQANNSRSQMGQYVAAGQLVSLDPYAKAYGWKDRFSPSVLQYTSFSPDGKTWGEGSVYGLPQVGEIVGVFYSKSKLADLGLEVPQTWADFEGQLPTIKDAGQTPLLLGNIEQWPALHVFGPIQGATVPADQVRTLGFGNKGASWTTPENVKAATTIQDWAKKGYFNEGFNGTDYDAAWKSLTEGKGVYLIGGSWLAADLQAAMGDDVGFFAPPPVEAGKGPVTTGGTGIPFAITSKAENRDVAAAYINFVTSDEAMKVLAETGNMPVVNTAAHTPPSGVQADVFQAYADATEKGQLLPYLDNATPTMNTTIGQALQALMAGQTSPQQFTETVEKDYADFVASNG